MMSIFVEKSINQQNGKINRTKKKKNHKKIKIKRRKKKKGSLEKAVIESEPINFHFDF
ncbi:hypothetical protein [Niallia sp. 03133]|uniref:hypothetical protein n=1 Tax=Niallia sp. 03133 TaxID=3458060 RepID=UPI00404465EA